MRFFKRVFKPFQKCAKNQPIYEPIQRIPTELRQSSISFIQITKQKKKDLPTITNLLVEIGDLINKLERRMYCFMTELERTKTNNPKYKSLLELYNNIKPNMTNIMTTYSYLLEEKDTLNDVSNEFIINIYLKILRDLRDIGFQLLQYITIEQNMATLNYRYEYQTDTKVPKCFMKSYPQVTELMMKGKPNSQINQRKYELISKCIEKKKIPSQCIELYDAGLASGSRDVFIMQAFMRIELLINTIKKERLKLNIQRAIQENIEKQENTIDSKIFRQLKKLTQGANMLPREKIILKNRSCVPQQQKQQQKPQQQKPQQQI